MSTPLVEVENAQLHYKVGSAASAMLGLPSVVKAVDGITFTLNKGESVGLLGESGCGKTSMGRLLVKLEDVTGGSARFDGAEIAQLKGTDLRKFRSRSQMIFQNPFDAVNPRYSIKKTMAEPLGNAGIPKTEWDSRIIKALELVRLAEPEQYLDRYPHQLSGGQLQRVVMARALILEPDFVVADEPVSMLDVSVRAGVLNVFREVRDKLGLTAIYISHDLALVRYVCERTIVMYLGRIMEDGPTEEIVRDPLHPYTQALVAAVPTPKADQSHDPLPIGRGAPDPRNPPSGCVFRDRCPKAFGRCATDIPLPQKVGNRDVACHLFDERS
ncbi:ABC transporter ATP-binding protein [Sulfitobacter geojensis]|uniref:ABC transporter ATP-binding protein n=1 Tax=Sulfitobacter geojensis TaxID=1342299 RepID=UPI000AAF7825|nr:ABC transporter ATP-binding protein [Sulfitobacter geojensis]KHA50904.1 Oligopeptide/dipeptide ABC transporter, ATP-binding protein [Sulfitobacter geojensis]NYI26721.1 peptide/nickel transport system ATP-binding protein [Sulfitobacter geojensis]